MYRSRSIALALALFAGAVVVLAPPAAAAVSVTSLSPNQVAQGRQGVNITINGSGFSSTGGAPSASVSGSGVGVASTTLVSATQLIMRINVDPNAAIGARTVTVKQGVAGIDAGTCTGCLSIVARPTVTSYAPTASSNTGSVTLTLAGTNFAQGATVSLVHSGQSNIVGGTSTVSTDGTSLTAPVNLVGAPPGLRWSVKVTNPDLGSGSNGDGNTTGLLITGGQPTLTSISPTTAGQGATNRLLTLHGSNLARGAAVAVSGTGVTVVGTAWQDLNTMTATINVDSTAPIGARNITVTNTDTQAVTRPNALTITAQPVVTSLAPNSFGQGATAVPVKINGAGFTAGTPSATVSGTNVAIDHLTYVSATEIDGLVSVSSAAATGARNVTVSNGDGGTATLPAGLTVAAGPAVSSVTPSSRGQGSTATLTIAGSNFRAGATVSFSGDSKVHAGTTTVASATSLTVPVSVDADATVGPRDVSVKNTDGGTATKANAFAVATGPSVTSIAPNAIGQGATGRTVVVHGGGFAAVPTVTFSAAGLTASNVTWDSATQLTLSVNATPSATVGAADVTIRNPDGGTTTVTHGVTVAAHPSITSLTPSTYGRGFSGTVTIAGQAFQATPTLVASGSGVSLSNVVRTSATQLTATVTVAANAGLGVHDVTVTNPDGGVSVCANCITVNSGPAITSVTPNGGANSGTVSITDLAGSGFAPNATASLQRTGQSDIPLTNSSVDSSGSHMTGTFDLSGAGGAPAAPGAWNLRVVNPTDGGAATLANGFTVAGNAPSISTVAPAAAPQGVQRTLALTGTNFASGATVTLSGTGITVGPPSVVSASHIDVPVTIGSAAPTGARNITVTNTDGQSTTCTACFSISQAPSLTSITPAAFGQGATNIAATIKGAAFQATPGVTASGTGVTITGVNQLDASTLQVRVAIDPAAATGTRDLTVTNGDGGSATLANAITVNAGPAVSSVTPAALGQGATNVTETITGTGFAGTPSLVVSGSGVNVTSVTRNSATQLTAIVTVDLNAATGARTLTITNPDGGTVSKAAALTVDAAPRVTSISPSSISRDQSNLSVTINGSGFQSTPTVTVFGNGLSTASVTRVSDTQLTAQLSATTAATSGLHDLTVTNPDGGNATLLGAVKVTDRDLTFSPWTTVTSSGITSGTAVTTWGPGRLDVFYRATDNSLGHRWYVNNTWWSESLGGQLTDAPAAVAWANGRIDVVVRGTDNALYWKWFDGSSWQGFARVGGNFVGAPAISSWAAGRLDVFVRGTDNGLWHAYYNGAWNGWEGLGGTLASSPAAVSTASNTVDVFVRAGDGTLWRRWWDGGAWRGYDGLGGSFTGDLAASSWGAGRLELFAVAGDQTLSWRTMSNGSWTNYLPLPGPIGAGPSAVSWSPNHIDVFAQGAGQQLLWRTASP